MASYLAKLSSKDTILFGDEKDNFLQNKCQMLSTDTVLLMGRLEAVFRWSIGYLTYCSHSVS